ncbi:MAG: 16S rRNA (guanine(966)-N(2))-methyltransferase RsmD [Hyphomicrobium sp.]
MRIVGGKYARRNLVAPPGSATRPTSDRVREAIFNILCHHPWPSGEILTDADVLDVCCGTGAMGLEALSRGARAAWFMDMAPPALQATQANITALKCGAQTHILRCDATKPPLAARPCGLIFIDPPYHKNLPDLIVPALIAAGWVAPQALLVIETARDETLLFPDDWEPALRRDYGATSVHFVSAPLE